jgi:putative ABC transport system ATP-binding protein
MTADPLAGAVALEARGITVRRAGRAVLDGVSLLARPGQILAVTGPSGAGKSTLLGVLAGVLTPDAGQVTGRPEPGDERTVGIVLQGHGLLSILSAVENVGLPLQIRGHAAGDTVARAHAALERAALPDHDDRLVEELSGGQQQRVSVARALVIEPALLLADEPTSELDAVTRDQVMLALRTEADRGAVVVVATHDEEVAERCEAVLHLLDGRVVDLVDGRVVDPPA